MTRPFFAKDRVTDFGLFDTKVSMALQKMQERFNTGEAVDFQVSLLPMLLLFLEYHRARFQDICGRFTMDSIYEFLLGTSINSLQDPLPRPGQDLNNIDTHSTRFLRAFASAQTGITTRARIGVSWPLFEIFKERTEKDMKVVRGVIEPIVWEAMRKREQGNMDEKDNSLLQHLLDVTQGSVSETTSLLSTHENFVDRKLIVDQTLKYVLYSKDLQVTHNYI